MKLVRSCFCLLFFLALFAGGRVVGYAQGEREEFTQEEQEMINMLNFLENYELLKEEMDFLDNYEVLGEENEE